MKKIKLTKKQEDETMKIEISQEGKRDEMMFMHCKHCAEKFIGSEEHSKKSPRDKFSYEISSYPFTYPNGETCQIFAVWCKTCGRPVWDSRHLTHLF